jgi:xanthine dehydrogenase YagR molybdenum-binding subunit
LRVEINGSPFEISPRPDETAVEVIRERCGLTGAKLVCGAGVCGACTVLLDGTPVASCLLPAQALEGRQAQTVEGLGPELHPVQKALMACDGLQCGFCTPGFVMEGVAFYERWRAAHGTAEPSREEVAGALAGHLCRCGAYAGIYAAIQGACAGRFDQGPVEPVRVEAEEKVSGRAIYTVDVRYPGQLEGVIVRSPHPHARVGAIDAAAARALPGVRAVVDLLDERRTVRYVGQEVAAIAADDLPTARAARALLRVDYTPLPAVIGAAAARKAGAPLLYSGLRKRAVNAGEGMLLPATWDGNTRKPLLALTNSRPGTARRRIAQARAAASPQLVAGTWTAAPQSHTALEPHAAVARWHDDGLTVHVSTQAAHRMAREVAEHFDLSDNQVEVRCEHVGGAFGSKLELTMETIAAVTLARAANAPVRVALDRLEELSVGGYRPGAEMHMALLAGPQGEPLAMTAEAHADSGIGVGSQVAVLMGLTYTKVPRDLTDYDVVNNVAPGKPFRGPGGPLAAWAVEGAMDELAHRLDVSPIALRRRWDDHSLRHRLYDWAENLPVWRERGRAGADTGRYRRGVGVAAANWLYLFHSATMIEVASGPEGLTVTTASQDMGNGTRSSIARAAAAVFGIPPHTVQVRVGSSRAPRGPLSGGSRTTPSVFWPTQQAAEQVRGRLVAVAVAQLGLRDARVVSGGIDHAGGHLPWPEIFRAAPPQRATVGRGLDPGLPAMPLAFGADDINTGRGFTGSVHVAEVEVDTRLGKVRPLRIWGGLAVGRIVAPDLARSQCYGAIIQGVGYALYERREVDQASGHTLSAGLEDYRIPGIGDTPEMTIHFVEEGFEHARGGLSGLSELATLGVAASLGNAVFNATGWRPYHLPILPEHVIEGVR